MAIDLAGQPEKESCVHSTKTAMASSIRKSATPCASNWAIGSRIFAARFVIYSKNAVKVMLATVSHVVATVIETVRHGAATATGRESAARATTAARAIEVPVIAAHAIVPDRTDRVVRWGPCEAVPSAIFKRCSAGSTWTATTCSTVVNSPSFPNSSSAAVPCQLAVPAGHALVGAVRAVPTKHVLMRFGALNDAAHSIVVAVRKIANGARATGEMGTRIVNDAGATSVTETTIATRVTVDGLSALIATAMDRAATIVPASADPYKQSEPIA